MVAKFLDITTAHVTEAEMLAINSRFRDVDEDTPRVVPHEYGAWVNVEQDPCREQHFAHIYPNVAACLKRARELDCVWINFDQDAGQDDVLPTYEW